MNKLEKENQELKSTINALRHKVSELSIINSALVNQLGGGVVITPTPKKSKPVKAKTAGVKPAKVQQPKPKLQTKAMRLGGKKSKSNVKPVTKAKAKVEEPKGVKIEAVDKSTALGIAVRNLFFK